MTIHAVSRSPDQDIIDVLTETLAEAQRGELRGVGIITIDRSNVVGTRVRGHQIRHSILAGACYLQRDLCKEDA